MSRKTHPPAGFRQARNAKTTAIRRGAESLVIAALLFVFALSPAASAIARWDWHELGEAETAFCDQYMPPILELRKTHGTDAALAEMEKTYQLAEKRFSNAHFFHRVVWFEAQVKGGKEDEEWGLAIFKYLLERDLRKNPQHAIRIPAGDYCLYGNIIGRYHALGMMARQRAVCMQVEDNLNTQKGMDTSGASYADIGPVFSFLPEARRREFPVYEQDLSARNPEDVSSGKNFIYYPYLYGLGDVADSALLSGDWVQAAELSDWSIRYSDEYMKGNNHMRDEVGKNASYVSSKRLADLALLHGYPAEAAKFLEDYIAKGEGYYKAWESTVLRAKLDLAVVKIELGGLTDADMALADEAAQKIAEEPHNDRSAGLVGALNKARVYHALNHRKEAWAIVDDLFAQTENDVNPHHRIRMLAAAIDLALADGGTRPELEEWLVLALDNARLAGNKYNELPLYEKYAQFLMLKGRFSEAAQIQQEAIRLSNAMNLPKRLENNLSVLAAMQKVFENETVASPTPAIDEPQPADPEKETIAQSTETVQSAGNSGATLSPPVDIQPRLSLSAALPGQAAYGRFYVHNPSTVSRQGELRLTGPIDQVAWQGEHWLTASASPAFPTEKLVRTLTLKPGESCIVDIAGLPLEDGRGAEVACQWIPQNPQQTGVSGIWECQTSATEKRSAVIDAHELQSNPFYLVPIHHMIQRLDTGRRQTVDFTVEASVPMRIEAYAAETGRLLAIDANGDGDFLDKGDFIANDDNRNSWPDLVFAENQKLSSLVMYIQPDNQATTEQTLTVKILADSEWRVDAIDVIRPYASR